MKNVFLDLELEPATVERLRALPAVNLTPAPPPRDGSARAFPAELLRDQHVLVCKLPPTNFGDCKALELLQIATVGFEHLAPLRLGESPVRLCNARGLFDTAIAEWNLAMMVNLARDLRSMVRNQEARVWDRAARFQQEIRGRVVGLWGYGGIGRETARLARALGMTVHALTRAGVRPRHNDFTLPGTGDPDGRLPDRVFVRGQEREFLGTLDFLVLALPRTAETTGLVGEAELRALPRTAFLLNPARGPIVAEAALLRALREGWIAGAAIDTHYAYPLPAEHPLWSFPNVILTPHISGADRSVHFRGRMGELVAANLDRYLAGRPLLNEVTKEELRESDGVA